MYSRAGHKCQMTHAHYMQDT